MSRASLIVVSISVDSELVLIAQEAKYLSTRWAGPAVKKSSEGAYENKPQ
jgi:hypothetical protein